MRRIGQRTDVDALRIELPFRQAARHRMHRVLGPGPRRQHVRVAIELRRQVAHPARGIPAVAARGHLGLVEHHQHAGIRQQRVVALQRILDRRLQRDQHGARTQGDRLVGIAILRVDRAQQFGAGIGQRRFKALPGLALAGQQQHAHGLAAVLSHGGRSSAGR